MLLTLLLVAAAAWGGMALWLRLPYGDAGRGLIVAALLAAMLLVVMLVWRRTPVAAGGLLALAWLPLLLWWSTILPSNDRDWRPDVARVSTARIDGDMLTVRNVRNFNWRSDTNFDPYWETRVYDLKALRGADLFLSYWSGELIAHAIISFDFAGTLPLAYSIEIRREKGEQFSSIAGFFKSYELVVTAADERDVVKVRSVVRGEDVRLFRLDIEPATTQGLLREYVSVSNDLAANPRWYHTLAANCTTVIFGMARRLDPRVAFDWRILLPGRLPEYLRANQFITRDVPLHTLVTKGRIRDRAAGAYPDPGFSARIREGVPAA